MRRMKKALRVLGLLVLGGAVLVGGFAAYVAWSGIPRYAQQKPPVAVHATPEKLARGKRLATMLCADCHLDAATGGFTGHVMADAPHEFGPICSKNITGDRDKGIGAWSDGELAYFLRTGVDRNGQYVPPYMVKLPLLADDDMESLLVFLRSDDPWVRPRPVDPPSRTRPSFLTKLLSHVAFKPLPYPERPIGLPPAGDAVASGRYLSNTLGCFSCHAPDFKTIDDLEPEKTPGYMSGGNRLLDMSGQPVLSANLTPHPTAGIGAWSAADFDRALRTGVRPDGRRLRFPMRMLPELTAEESGALYAYLRTVPPIDKPVLRPAPTVAETASSGERIYTQYGCASCHGTTGIGVADLRHAAEHYPDDRDLIAWIKNPASNRPGVKMPSWEGVIPEQDFPALVAYVKELGRHP
jgi:mono/diheme cytochrome c family protein